ncbi:MAG TPA: hypothetical protein VLA90_09880, partial [Actinomycetota bacterium]|nr:hypothetical protein [Actinomycetota bacterium]
LKGGLTTVVAFVLFVGSVLLLLSAVFGRRMGYLVLAVGFFGWMFIMSFIWLTGFWISQGLDTPVNLGPRGAEPGWVVESVGTDPEPVFEAYSGYPTGQEWRVPGSNNRDSSSVQSVTTAAQGFLAERANEDLGLDIHEPGAVQTSDFEVEQIRFATDGDVSLAAAQAYFTGGGPRVTLFMRHDPGSVNRYSWMFLIGSAVGLAIHVPLLDRAERRRKEILTGGAAPPWYGPA